jgi:ligand-binding SRPBCC domain-containing protein
MEKVWNGFDRKLFDALLPKFPHTKVLRFDGCNIGDEVHTELHFFGQKQKFYARIIEREIKPSCAYFIDKGIILPFFLSSWQHKHIITRLTENTCSITDEIQFSFKDNVLAEAFLFPIIYAQLFLRKPVYKKYFYID